MYYLVKVFGLPSRPSIAQVSVSSKVLSYFWANFRFFKSFGFHFNREVMKRYNLETRILVSDQSRHNVCRSIRLHPSLLRKISFWDHAYVNVVTSLSVPLHNAGLTSKFDWSFPSLFQPFYKPYKCSWSKIENN